MWLFGIEYPYIRKANVLVNSDVKITADNDLLVDFKICCFG